MNDISEQIAALSPEKLASLAKRLKEKHRDTFSKQIIPQRSESDFYALSFAQTRLWFLDQLEGETATYNMPFALQLTGPLQVTALEQSLTEIVRRHEALRTTFSVVDDSPVQVIASPTSITLPVVNLRMLSAAEQSREVQRLVSKEAQRPFDLASGSLLRVSLIQLSEDEYVLLLVMHHIVSDGWSMGIFIRELSALYEAFFSGELSPLPELPIQYADFAVWQRQWLSGEVLQTQLQYWKQQLAGAPPLLELLTNQPRPSVQTFRGNTLYFELNADLTQKLKSLSQKSGATLFITLLTAFNILLSRYSGQSDIVIGSPIANRNHSEIEPLIGFFVNTLVLRNNLEGNPSFLELLSRVRQVALDAYANQDLPFEKLVEELQPERSLSYTPLFQVMFALENAPIGQLELPGLTITPLQLENVTSKVDLSLSMEETLQGMRGAWEYSTDLFDAVTITRMFGHFQTLLEVIVANPEQHLTELPLLTKAEWHQLLVKWNDTHLEYPQDKCIHQLFEEQVELTPDAVALVYQNEQLTYRELNTRANQLAHHLQSLGVGPEVLVGICVERSLEMVVGLLGILKAGGAYVPLDPTYPQERLAYMLSDSLLSVLLTQEKLVADLPEHTAHVVCLDSQWGVISCESQENPVSGVQPSHLAYVIYTSGSTGKPKGVLVAHQGLCNLAQAQIRLFDVNSDSRVLQFASFSFDASIWEVVMALGSGARLCLGTKDSLLPGPNLMQFLRTYNITHVTLPPSTLTVLPYEELPALRTIIVAGEACSPDLVAQWSKDRRFFNAYGPTESTVCATVAECTDSSNQPSIGRPIANTQIYILDSHLQPVPIGVLGELYIGGAGLAKGYLNRPELTQEKFIPNPFSQQEGARLYKTGDLARYLPDGNIEFLGRIDHQVKIRGFRIELGEIEAALSQHPEVGEAVVIACDKQLGDKCLVAYVTLKQKPGATVSELRRFFKEMLPEYMVPSAFVMLDALPLTPNGKVDRKALPFHDRTHLEQEGTFVAPRTPLEEVIAEIWAEVLGLKRVGIHDNFFELGGHSLLATQLISRVCKAFCVKLPLHSLFETPTVAGMCQAINVMDKVDTFDTINAYAVTDLNAEAILDPTICPKTLPVKYVTEPNCILLTGATGFLGAFLLHELLEQTQADIYCLVRSFNAEEAKKKIENNLKYYLVWNEYFSSRIIPIVGDLSQPLLGLSFEQFQMMASKIDIIYHNGALVNSIYPYSALKATNVLGTQEILRLATQIKVKPVHFISTLSVFSSNSYSKTQVILEQDNLDSSEGVGFGYAESKWVAEKLLMIARSRGLPVCIYRPGRISGHSQTGGCQTDDFLWRIIKGCIQLGSIPDLDIMVDLTPVDYVSKAIVHLSRQSESLMKAFHLVNPHSIHFSKLIEWMKSFGYQLEQISYEKWRAELINVANLSSENAMYPLVPLFYGTISEQQTPDQTKKPQFDYQNTLNGLAGTSIICSPVNAELLSTYFSYFIRSGYLSAPSQMTALG